MSGPLAPFAGAFWAEVLDQGYTPAQAAVHARIMAHLSQWMTAQGLSPGDLDGDEVQRFVDGRKAEGYRTMVSNGSLDLVVAYLREAGMLVDEPGTALGTDLGCLLEDYRHYLRHHRGLASSTAHYRVEVARLFLAELPTPLAAGLAGLGTTEVTSFLLRQCRSRAVPSAKAVATAMRCLLRFLLQEGKVSVPLVHTVPTVAHWRSSLPRGVEPATVRRLLASCDRRTAVGRRDYAILVLFAALRPTRRRGSRLSPLTTWTGGQLIWWSERARPVAGS